MTHSHSSTHKGAGSPPYPRLFPVFKGQNASMGGCACIFGNPETFSSMMMIEFKELLARDSKSVTELNIMYIQTYVNSSLEDLLYEQRSLVCNQAD